MSGGEDDATTPRTQAARRGLGGYWTMMKDGYEELVKAICRPPRAEYGIEELGPAEFSFGGASFVREDCTLTNPRGLKLHGSFWHRTDLPEGGSPCVVYTHGNASCRAESLQVMAPVLASGASLFAFDFAGCGHSEGDYISLGWHEKDDLATALTYLRESGRVTAIMLWGRSMGAVSAVLQASRDPSLAGLILDSPFASLEQVALELVTTAPETVPGAPHVPSFLVKTALHVVQGSVKSRAKFDLYKLRPVDAARTCFVPALFGCAANDILVRPHHSQQIHDEYAGDKNIVRFDGDHNDLRPGFFMDSAAIFMKQVLLIPDEQQLEVPLDREGRPLPIYHTMRQSMHRARRAPPPRANDFGGALTNPIGADFGGAIGDDGDLMAQTAGHSALEAYEEELLRQAILASLGDAPPVEGVVAAAPAPAAPNDPPDLSDAPGDAVGETAATEAELLEAAIRLSLESSEREARERQAAEAGAPASAPASAELS